MNRKRLEKRLVLCSFMTIRPIFIPSTPLLPLSLPPCYRKLEMKLRVLRMNCEYFSDRVSLSIIPCAE